MKKINFLIVALTFFFFLSTSVSADHSASDGSAGNSSSCSSSYCYNNALGIRLTLVTREGKRCRYNPTTKALCNESDASNSSLSAVKSIDIWTKEREGMNADACHSSNMGKPTKKEFVDHNSKNYGGCRSNYGNYTLFSEWDTLKRFDDYLGHDPKFSENFIAEFDKALDPRRSSSSITQDDAERLLQKMIKKMLNGIVSDYQLREDSNVIIDWQNALLEFDQLLYWQNASNGSLKHAVMGTVAEVTYWYKNKVDQTVWCITGNTNNLNGVTHYGCSHGDSLISTSFATQFYAPESGGIKAGLAHYKSDFPSNSSASGFSTLYGDNTLNVAFLWLGNIQDCDYEVGQLTATTRDLENKLSAIATKYSMNFTGLESSKLNRMHSFNRKIFGFPNSNEGSKCRYLTCDNMAEQLEELYYNNRNLYNTSIGTLQSYYPDRPLLKEEYWKDLLHLSGPKCRPYDIPECDPATVRNVCGEDLVFQDNTNNADSCWKSGIAYTVVGGAVSSYATGNRGCNLYCTEKVTFNLPREVDGDVRSGGIFKWGVEQVTSSSKFATMTIERTCTGNSPNNDCEYTTGTGENRVTHHRTIPAYNSEDAIKAISTTMTIEYREPSTNLDLLSDSDSRDGNVALFSLVRSDPVITGTTSKDRYRCSDESCSGYGSFNTKAVYTFSYGDSLKWYSSKNDNSVYSNRTGDNYYEIGYGLPTAFTTPSGNYGNSGDGKMAVRIENVGTNNRFQRVVSQASGGLTYITYDCKFKINNELFDNECQYDADGNLIAGSPNECDPNDKDGKVENKVKGVDVVFRTVHLMANSSIEQLSRAFPGRSGSGRSKIGKNWVYKTGTYEEDKKYSLGELYNILNENVYTNEPMYKIKLTVSTIQNIRKLNANAKAQSKDPYTEMEITSGNEGNGFIGYECRKGSEDNVFCASNFLSHLYGLPTNPLGGRCVTSTNTRSRAVSYRDTGCV